MAEHFQRRLLNWVWDPDFAVRAIRILGVAMTFFCVAIALYFFIREASVLLREGVDTFVLDLIVRLIAIAIVSACVYIPYGVAIAALHDTGRRRLFVVLSVIFFAAQGWINVRALFWADSSTSSLAVVVWPFGLAVLVAIFWGVARMVQRDSRR